MKRFQILLLLACFSFVLASSGFSLVKNDETTGVTFKESSFSDALAVADKPIMIDFWSDG